MKTCVECMTDKPEEAFYKRKNSSAFGTCMKTAQRGKFKSKGLTRAPMNYKDYLKQQGMYEYYKKVLKYQV